MTITRALSSLLAEFTVSANSPLIRQTKKGDKQLIFGLVIWIMLPLQLLVLTALVTALFFGLVYSDLAFALFTIAWVSFLVATVIDCVLIVSLLVNRRQYKIPNLLLLLILFTVTLSSGAALAPFSHWSTKNGHYDHTREPDWNFCRDTGVCD